VFCVDRQDELDRREQQIERLTGQVGELEETTSTLQQELVIAHEEAAKLTSETERLRQELEQPPSEDHTAELNRLKERCNSLQEMLDAHQLETRHWENALIEERARRQQLEQERAGAEKRERQAQAVADQEKQVARQLQQALEELEYGQESDHQRMVDEMQQKAEAAESELENYKLRIDQMETYMDEANQAKDRCGSLEQEVKEKNLLIGKLRHEAVILNEHLTGALNRLRRDSADEQIDRCVRLG